MNTYPQTGSTAAAEDRKKDIIYWMETAGERERYDPKWPRGNSSRRNCNENGVLISQSASVFRFLF